MATLATILRHPIKSIGREEVATVDLKPGGLIPFDRKWGVQHERSQLDGGWARKSNFLRGVAGPSLMAVRSKLDDVSGDLTLSHPDLADLTARPDSEEDAEKIIDWLRPIWPDDKARPTGIYRAKGAHLTDTAAPWLSINSLSSLKALSQRAGSDLSMHRFRGNLWIDGLAPWEEFDWVGRTIRIGTVELAVRDQITRCKATMANPETGRRDVDTLDVLDELGHQEFGVFAEVVTGGTMSVGDTVGT